MTEAAFPSQFRKDMGKLQQNYLERLKNHLTDFRRLREMAAQKIVPRRDLQHLYRLSHQLAGSGATFGFPDISFSARELHAALKDYLDAPEDSAPPLAPALDKLQSFERACLDAIGRRPQEASERLQLPNGPALQLDRGANDVYIIATGRDATAANKLGQGLESFGYGAFVVTDLEAFAEAYKNQFLKAVVVYSALDERDRAHIHSIIRTNPAVPVLIVSPYGDFEARLAAARLGAHGYFTGTPDMLAFVEKIETMAEKFAREPDYRVVIVDDDEMLAQFYAHSLQRAGMKTIVVNNPKDALEAILENEVNLVLMDYHMPACNGRELAAVIRQHDKCLRLPIVFLSAQENLEEMLTSSGLGIDDFLVKPFSPPELIAVVQSRAQRAGELEALMVRDSFTGLLNHARFNETMEQEISLTRRTRAPAAYATIDIDHFKSINDTYGHQAGDIVLKTLSRIMQQHLRRTDIIGRCGGEEFGILMPGCGAVEALQVVENLRRKVTEAFFEVPGQKLRITFSGGVAAIDGTAAADEVMRRADEALYRAKQGGRNRVLPAGEK